LTVSQLRCGFTINQEMVRASGHLSLGEHMRTLVEL